MAKKKGRRTSPTQTKAKGPTAFDVRLRIVREVLRGAKQADVAMAFGVSVAAVQKYLGLFRDRGVEGLRRKLAGAAAASVAKAASRGLSSSVKERVIEARREHGEWGPERIR